MKILNNLKSLYLTHLGRILSLIIIVVITQIIIDRVSNDIIFDIAYYITMISSISLFIYLLIIIIYAWIINPIKNNNKKINE